jgi:sugar lactone lactonase YvrE
MTEKGWAELGPAGAFYECPRWHDGRWWSSDFYADEVVSVDESGNARVEAHVPGHPGGLGWLPDGRLLVVSMEGRAVLRREPDGTLVQHADVAPFCGGKANDMLVLEDGTAYVGNFGFDLDGGADPATTTLAVITPDGEASAAADDLAFPNGMALADAGRTLVVGETFAARHTAFTVGPRGELGDRRVWAQVAPAVPFAPLAEMVPAVDYAPDGCAIDAEGRLWVADSLHGRVVRVAEGGEILAELRVPAGLLTFACALGGADGRTLLVTVAPDFSPEARSAARESRLLTARVDVPGTT